MLSEEPQSSIPNIPASSGYIASSGPPGPQGPVCDMSQFDKGLEEARRLGACCGVEHRGPNIGLYIALLAAALAIGLGVYAHAHRPAAPADTRSSYLVAYEFEGRMRIASGTNEPVTMPHGVYGNAWVQMQRFDSWDDLTNLQAWLRGTPFIASNIVDGTWVTVLSCQKVGK